MAKLEVPETDKHVYVKGVMNVDEARELYQDRSFHSVRLTRSLVQGIRCEIYVCMFAYLINLKIYSRDEIMKRK